MLWDTRLSWRNETHDEIVNEPEKMNQKKAFFRKSFILLKVKNED